MSTTEKPMTDKYFLSKGKHNNPQSGRCAMEWVSYLAGEQHSDKPQCVSLVLTRFCITLNDRLPDEERQKLRPYLARTIGTRGDGRDQERLRMCHEFLLHQALPVYLDRAGRTEAAASLRALPGDLAVEGVRQVIYAVREEAWKAREEAVGRLSARIRAELARRGIVAVADAAAAVDADADADADAVAVAAVVADAAAAAAVDAAAVADAAAAVDAAAVAVAVVAAVAAVVADAAAARRGYWAIRAAVRERLRNRAIEVAREMNRELLPSTFALLDRMLPTEVIQLPVVEDARLVCGVHL